MITAPESNPAQERRRAGGWRIPPLLAGVCFGLGYGVVQRLMAIEFPQLVELGQPFAMREFPGTSLEDLRLKTGAEVQSIRGDLGVLELEAQDKATEQVPPKPSEPSLEPAPLIQPLPAEQGRFSEPLDREPDPEPVQQEFLQEEAPPDLPDQPTP
jgi:hypothetical protein